MIGSDDVKTNILDSSRTFSFAFLQMVISFFLLFFG